MFINSFFLSTNKTKATKQRKNKKIRLKTKNLHCFFRFEANLIKFSLIFLVLAKHYFNENKFFFY